MGGIDPLTAIEISPRYIFALIDGTVVFRKKANDRSYVSVTPLVAKPEVVAEA